VSEKVLLEKTYVFLAWLSGRVAKFPKDHKYTLGNRLSTTAYDFLEGLIYIFGDEEARALKRLSKKLDILRYYVRLSMDLKVLNMEQYAFAAERMDEIGRLLGGWINAFKARKEIRRGADASAQGDPA
jgi:hypothetical protein